jgi:hypothetical protein
LTVRAKSESFNTFNAASSVVSVPAKSERRSWLGTDMQQSKSRSMQHAARTECRKTEEIKAEEVNIAAPLIKPHSLGTLPLWPDAVMVRDCLITQGNFTSSRFDQSDA